MKELTITAFIAASVIAPPAIAGDFQGSIKMGHFDDEEAVMEQVKVDIVQAIEIAKKKVDGFIVEAELEKEDGYLVWGMEFLGKNNKKHELYIDPVTGEVLAMEQEGKR
ncbi:MAG TPA: hypothetical protein DCY89_04865 [Gammaproteobacteria bacterium]|nr:hypothetical protein [Gammaproteobacteria bacterium]